MKKIDNECRNFDHDYNKLAEMRLQQEVLL